MFDRVINMSLHATLFKHLYRVLSTKSLQTILSVLEMSIYEGKANGPLLSLIFFDSPQLDRQ